jgi:NDP-sugar pyrophosphorylase family protein
MRNTAEAGGAVDAALLHQARAGVKAMLGVGPGARPFMDYLLLSLSRAGYRDVMIVVGDHDDSIRGYYEIRGGKDRFPDLRLSFTGQPIPAGRTKPMGTADALERALLAAPRWQGRKLTVCNADNLYSERAHRMLLEDRHAGAMIDYDRSALRFSPERIEQFSVIRKDAEGFLREIIEKPTPEQIERAAEPGGRVGVSMNIFRFSYDAVLPCLREVPVHAVRQEKELPVAVQCLVTRDSRGMFTIPLSEHVVDLTSPSDIPAVRAWLEREFPRFG